MEENGELIFGDIPMNVVVYDLRESILESRRNINENIKLKYYLLYCTMTMCIARMIWLWEISEIDYIFLWPCYLYPFSYTMVFLLQKRIKIAWYSTILALLKLDPLFIPNEKHLTRILGETLLLYGDIIANNILQETKRREYLIRTATSHWMILEIKRLYGQ